MLREQYQSGVNTVIPAASAAGLLGRFELVSSSPLEDWNSECPANSPKVDFRYSVDLGRLCDRFLPNFLI